MKTIIEDNRQNLKFSVTDGYDLVVSDYNWFLTAKDREGDSDRKIDKVIAESEITKEAGLLTFNINLYANDTIKVTKSSLRADVQAVSKTNSEIIYTVWNGKLSIDLTVRDGQDVIPQEQSVVAIYDASDYEVGDHLTIKEVDGKKVWIQESIEELKIALGVNYKTYSFRVFKPFGAGPVIVSTLTNTFGLNPIDSFTESLRINGEYNITLNPIIVASMPDLKDLEVIITPIDGQISTYTSWNWAGNIIKLETVSTTDFTTKVDSLNHILRIRQYL